MSLELNDILMLPMSEIPSSKTLSAVMSKSCRILLASDDLSLGGRDSTDLSKPPMADKNFCMN